MILPTKHIPENCSLLGVGGTILALLSEREATVSSLWEGVQEARPAGGRLSFDWFILSLDLLFALGSIRLDRGVLKKRARP
ncbi:MAG: ABC-three component system middle component 6 [Kiritimatiellia bacterium]